MRWTYWAAFAVGSILVVVVTISSLMAGHTGKRVSTGSTGAVTPEEPSPAQPPESSRRRWRAQGPAPAPQLQAPDELAKRSTDAPPKEPVAITSEQYHSLVNAAFEKQSPDPAWARDAALEISQTVIPLVENEASKASRLECRRDLCRFEVKNRDEVAARAALNAVKHRTAWNSGWMVTRSLTDPNVFTVILAKKGEEIPDQAQL
jgi:hypothetical protein